MPLPPSLPPRQSVPDPRAQRSQTTLPLRLLWNHRWEYDKGPELLVKCIQHLINSNVDFTLHVLGQQFRQKPQSLADISALLGDRLLTCGYVEDRAQYLSCLWQSDVVLSTAHHDFQGLSVLEAVQAGCIPVVPDRLAYQELFAPEYRYGTSRDEAGTAADMLTNLAKSKHSGTLRTAPSIEHMEWPALRPRYAEVFEQTIHAFHAQAVL